LAEDRLMAEKYMTTRTMMEVIRTQ
jgi:hypothetical protein